MTRHDFVSGFVGSFCTWLFVGGIGDKQQPPATPPPAREIQGVIRARGLEIFNENGDLIFEVTSVPRSAITLHNPSHTSFILMWVGPRKAWFHAQAGPPGLEGSFAALSASEEGPVLQLKKKGTLRSKEYE